MHINVGALLHIFRGALKLKDIHHPNGYMALLLGVHEAHLFPTTVLQSVNNLLLCQSVFSTVRLLV